MVGTRIAVREFLGWWWGLTLDNIVDLANGRFDSLGCLRREFDGFAPPFGRMGQNTFFLDICDAVEIPEIV